MDTGLDVEMLDIPEDPFTIPRGGYTLLGVSSIKISLPATVGTILAIAVIYNRLYWRLRMTYTLSLDDYLMFLAMVSCLCSLVRDSTSQLHSLLLAILAPAGNLVLKLPF